MLPSGNQCGLLSINTKPAPESLRGRPEEAGHLTLFRILLKEAFIDLLQFSRAD